MSSGMHYSASFFCVDMDRNNNPGQSGSFHSGYMYIFHPEDGKKATTIMHKDAFCCKNAYVLLFTLSVNLQSSKPATFFVYFLL